MKDKIDELYQKYLDGILPLIFDQNSPKVVKNNNEEIECFADKKIPNQDYKIYDSKKSDGYYIVINNNYKFNYVDDSGNLLCDIWYDDVNRFQNGFAEVSKYPKTFIINKKGIPINNDDYEFIQFFDNGLIMVENKDHKYNYINSEGKYISDFWFDSADYFYNNFARVKKDYIWYIINNKGEFLKDPVTNERLCFDYIGRCSEGYFRIIDGGRSSYIDTNGRLFSDVWFEPCEIDYIAVDYCYRDKYDFLDGLAIVKKDDKYNFVDTKGQTISSIWFDDVVRRYNNGVAIVRKDGKYNFFSREGCLTNSFWFDSIGEFHEGFAKVKKNDEYNYVNENGIVISKNWYKNAHDFHHGIALVRKEFDWFFIDANGNQVSDELFDDVWRFGRELYTVVKKRMNYFLVGPDGKKIDGISFDHFFCIHNVGYILLRENDKSKLEVNFFDNKGNLRFDRWYEVKKNNKGKNILISNGKGNNLLSIENGQILLKEWSSGLVEQQNLSYDIGHALVHGRKYGYTVDSNGKKTSYDFKIDKSCVMINGSFCKNGVNFECVNIDLNGYKVKKSLFGYVCEKEDDVFRTKYKPIKIYNKRYVLCLDNNNVILLDRINNIVLYVKSPKKIEFDNNFIFDLENSIVFLIYNDEMLNITDYYNKNLAGKKEINIDYSVKVQSKDDFTFENEEEINKELDKERKEQKKLQEAKREKEEKKRLEEAKINESKEQENLVKKQKEAFEQLKDALGKLEALGDTNVPVKRMTLTNLFINVDDHREINPMFLSNGLLRYIDFSLQSFENVKMDGIDFSGCNIHFDPQKIYQKNLRNCNLKKVYISPFMNFADVDIRGASFSDDDDPKTVDGFNASFRNAIYDETTTYNGKPFTEAFGECKNKPDIKVITKEE